MSVMSKTFETKEQFRAELKIAAKNAFEKALKEIGPEDICGFAFHTDEEAMTITTMVNTRLHLQEMIKEDPEETNYYRFTPDEWAQDLELAPLFSNYLYQLNQSTPEEAYEQYTKDTFHLFINILRELKEEGLFSTMKEDFLLLLNITDFWDFEFMSETFRLLNSPALSKEYDIYLNSQEIEEYE